MEDVNRHSIGELREFAPLLQRYGLKLVPESTDRFVDAIVEVPTSDGVARLPVVASILQRDDLRPSDLMLLQKSSPHGILALEDHIDSKRAREYHDLGIAHIDLAGNGWISLPGFKLWVERPQPATPHNSYSTRRRAAQPNRAFTPAGTRLVFVLLVAPDRAGAPLRELAHLAGISLGATSEAVQGLVEDSHLLAGDAERHIIDRPRLAAKWIESFRTRLLPSLKTLGFSGPAVSDVLHYVMEGEGSEMVAGEAIARSIKRNETITVYSDWPPTPLVRAFGLKRDRDNPTILVREKFWHEDVFDEVTPVAPELLTAAELIVSGDSRQQDAATAELKRVGLDSRE